MKGMAEWICLRESTLLRLLEIPRKRLPHQTTCERVLVGLDEEAFSATVDAFFTPTEADETWQIVLDGKVLRDTIPPGETQGAHLLGAYVPERGVVRCKLRWTAKPTKKAPPPFTGSD